MWLVLAMVGAGSGVGWLAWRLLRHASREAPGMDVLPWWWRVGAPWAERIAPRLVPLCPRHGYAWLCGTVARAGLPAAVRAEHLVAASLLAAIGGAAVAGAGLWVVPGVGPNGALAGLARTSGWSDALSWTLAGAGLAGPLPALWLRARVVERRRRIERELPFVLDMMILCVEAGLSVQAALQQATSSVPGGPLREGVAGALAQMRGGAWPGPRHCARWRIIAAVRWCTIGLPPWSRRTPWASACRPCCGRRSPSVVMPASSGPSNWRCRRRSGCCCPWSAASFPARSSCWRSPSPSSCCGGGA